MRSNKIPKFPRLNYIMNFEEEANYLKKKGGANVITKDIIKEFFNLNQDILMKSKTNSIFLHDVTIDGFEDIEKNDEKKNTYGYGKIVGKNNREVIFEFAIFKYDLFEKIKASKIHLDNVYMKYNNLTKHISIDKARLAIDFGEDE